MDINERLQYNKDNLDQHMERHKNMLFRDNDILVFDIEACAIKNHTEMLTYSIACISCFDESDTMYWYNDVEQFLDMLLNSGARSLKVYAHNCLYDIKPFILKFVEKYGNNEIKVKTYNRKEYDKYDKKEKIVKYKSFKQDELKPYEYNLRIKDGIFYGLDIQTETCLIQFLDSFKIIPQSLQSACSSFLGLNLSKDGLDYNKERKLEDELTKEELSYIYDDVYGLKYLVKLCCIDGFDVHGKHVKFTKITNSAQSMYDYKKTIIEDYENRTNQFTNENLFDYVDNRLMKSDYFRTKNYEEKLKLMFEALYPVQSCFMDNWLRLSYYGGLCTPHYENVAKFSKMKDHHGVVLDVNSLYPFVMKTFLLPYGNGNYSDLPYEKMNKKYKEEMPLYCQDITIYEFEIIKDKMPFIQVKGNEFFNGREILKNNKSKDGKLIEIHLRLCNPLFELLFENYDVKSYKLEGHIAFRGANHLFDNYIDFWSYVKQTSKGVKRAVAKLRQNGLYGKFGMSGDNEITNFVNNDGIFTIEHTKEFYVSNSVYLPMATFITSYAKQYLVQAINSNYDRFMYCDTDSIHLYGSLDEVKGVNIGEKIYGYWDNETCFDDFIYLSPKRYAERDVITGEWTIKCCGLTDKVMKNVDDVSVFTNCEYSGKEIKRLIKENKLYKKDDENDVYYYKDPECTKKIKGLFKSKKSRIVRYGTDIQEQPYMITKNNYI